MVLIFLNRCLHKYRHIVIPVDMFLGLGIRYFEWGERFPEVGEDQIQGFVCVFMVTGYQGRKEREEGVRNEKREVN